MFQSESPGMRQLLQGLKVTSPKELAIALSLIRPGPASGGMKTEFIKRHVHHKPFEYLHPSLKPLLQDTHGVMLYQEDVMRIAVDIAGYSVAEADRFRSEVSKKVSAARPRPIQRICVPPQQPAWNRPRQCRTDLGADPPIRSLFLL